MITISNDKYLVHLTETAELFLSSVVTDPMAWSSYERKQYFETRLESRGWGILTPEDNLLGFLKRRVYGKYRDNQYYATMGVTPGFTDGATIEHLALLAYDYPFGDEEKEDKTQWFQEICQKTVPHRVRHFVRVNADE